MTRALVERLEAVEAEVFWQVGQRPGSAHVERWGAGVLVASPAVHRSRAVGVTLEELGPDDVGALLGWFADRDVVAQVHLSAWSPAGTVAALAAAGLTPAWSRSVHALPLAAWEPGRSRRPSDLDVGVVGPSDVEPFGTTLLAALRSDERLPDASDRARAAAEHAAPDVTQLLARRDGAPAGAGLMVLVGDVVFLGPAGTLAAHRRRGVQGALLAARLDLARAAGAELALVTAAVDGATARNVERLGFTLVQQQWVLRAG